MFEENVHQTISAILLQAVEDYVSGNYDRPHILRELRSNHIARIAGEMGKIVANRLEFHLDEVAENIGKGHLLELAI